MSAAPDPTGATAGTPASGPRGGGADTTSTSSGLVALLEADTTHRWVGATSQTVGGQTIYDLTRATS